MKHENHWKWINGAYFWVKLIGLKYLIVFKDLKGFAAYIEEVLKPKMILVATSVINLTTPQDKNCLLL